MLHLEFTPHSWYKEFAIKKIDFNENTNTIIGYQHKWTAVTANGNTGYIDGLSANTLKDLRAKINRYHQRNAERDAYNRARLGEK